ncbi:RNA pyrophosphohydrolase [Acuticoccus sp. MNP-M23]|uniref:RNA pyrophosphohydrolase n=1 Tax=Acuticoccus sp. MNP-M23 TaxID=3072793 RepID=UPI002814F594|nr:RNA pyrophosphohydrolase [Acuticoccus sp. MNP-M23]WMS45156.1 RNA pyrophosphohydrolase [Acuticoccus sp. MNP-M23]
MARSRPGKGYRPCVGIALFDAEGRVFMGKRSSRGVVPKYSWQMPQGGIDKGETPIDAAFRELHEETSVRSVSLLGEVPGWLHYDLPSEMGAWRGRFRGQAQRWFAFRFEGEEAEINVTEPPDGHQMEFSRWRWEALAGTPDVVVPFKRPVYERVVEAFAPFAQAPLRGAQPQAI